MDSNLRAASNLIAMATNLVSMASNLRAMDGLVSKSDGLQPAFHYVDELTCSEAKGAEAAEAESPDFVYS